MRLLQLIVRNVDSIPLGMVEIHRIDIKHEDDNVEVHFFTGRVHLRFEHLSALSLLYLLEPESVAEL